MFSNLQALKIPQGDVVKIETNGVVLWELVTESYKNWLKYAIDTDGTIFDGLGYQKGYRISSSGVTKTTTYGSVTGYIPVKANDIIRFADDSNLIAWNDSTANTTAQCVGYYNSKFEFLGVFTLQPAYYGICNAGNSAVNGKVALGEGMITLTVPNNANIAYMRLGVATVHSDGTGIENLIVTVNEEITD